MAAPAQKKLLALDTNLLFDLAAKKDFAHAFREVYQERGYSLVVPPTVIPELTYYALVKQCAETPLALKALQQMRAWGLTPFDLKSVGHGITEQFSEKLMRLGLLPEGEFNDGLDSGGNGAGGYSRAGDERCRLAGHRGNPAAGSI